MILRKRKFTYLSLIFFLGYFIFGEAALAQSSEEKIMSDSIHRIVNKAYKYRRSKPDTAIALAKNALELAVVINDKKNEGNAYRAWALGERYKGNLTEAMRLQRLGLAASRAAADSLDVAATYINIGNIYKQQGLFSKALEYQLNALDLRKEYKDVPKAVATCYNNIGNLYRVMEDYDNAYKYHLKSLEMRQVANDSLLIASSMLNLGLVLKYLKRYDESIQYFNNALEYYLEKGNARSIAKAYANIGLLYVTKKDYVLAEKHLSKAREYNLKTKDKVAISSNAAQLAIVKNKLEKNVKALELAEESQALAIELKATNIEKGNYETLANIYSDLGDYKNAYKNHVEYKISNDSISDNTFNKALAEVRSKFEFEQQEDEIKELEFREKQQAKLRRWLIAGATVLFLSLLLAIWALRQRNRNLTILKKQKEETAALLAEKEKLLEDLSKAQGQLIASEKMASLGQLTAGIAHEINNPINFITSSVEALKLDFKDLKKLLSVLIEIEKSDDDKKLESLRMTSQSMDTQLLSVEMEGLITSIERGALRTKDIVKNLRTFSRSTSEEFLKADIHEGLESAVAILEHKMKGRIVLHKDYAHLPLIPCQISRLNQVFLNIIDNAIQAIDGKGEIFIKTSQQNGAVNISIKDTGKGMDKKTLQKLFEPFYTTKEVGKGTGLGLSISYGIIEQHGGKIAVNSEQENGAEFLINLPIHNKV